MGHNFFDEIGESYNFGSSALVSKITALIVLEINVAAGTPYMY